MKKTFQFPTLNTNNSYVKIFSNHSYYELHNDYYVKINILQVLWVLSTQIVKNTSLDLPNS